MSAKNYIKKIKTSYVINKVKKTAIPSFRPSPLVRKKIIFIGKVQNIGFRLEVYELAKRLGLTGHVKNKDSNKVELEIQGEEKKIFFLVANMKKLKRGRVSQVEIKWMHFLEGEDCFIIKSR